MDIDVARELFDDIDTDEDGYLDKAEICDWIMRLPLTSEEIEQMLSELDAAFEEADTDKDGMLSFEELKVFFWSE